MSELIVLDASALLAHIDEEPGADRVSENLHRACIGSVNLSEVIAKLSERGASGAIIDDVLNDLDLPVIPFDAAQATVAGKLRASTRSAGLSLGDRACLALALQLGATAMTTDRAWGKVDVGVTIDVLR